MTHIELTEQTCNDAEQTPPAIRLSGVAKGFVNGNQTIEVLNNVNLTVAPQAIVGLIGASGSGKSTLLNIISGILKPDRGQVCICGAASEEFNDWGSVSYMFQDDRLLPWRSAIRNVEFALEPGSIAKKDLETAEEGPGLRPPVRLHEADHDVDAVRPELPGSLEHGVGLANAGRGAEEELEPAAGLPRFFLLRAGEEGVWIRPLVGHSRFSVPKARPARRGLRRRCRTARR